MVHVCHAKGCDVSVAPHFLMCHPHWKLVPSHLQQLIEQTHRPGQENDKNPTKTWMKYARQAILYIVELEKESEGN